MMKRIAVGLALAAGGPGLAAAWTFDWAGHGEVDDAGLSSDAPAKRLDAVREHAKYDASLTQMHLMRALDARDDNVKLAAAKALGQGGSLVAVPKMIDWLSDVDPKVRQIAAVALGEIGGTDAAAALTRTLGDPD